MTNEKFSIVKDVFQREFNEELYDPFEITYAFEFMIIWNLLESKMHGGLKTLKLSEIKTRIYKINPQQLNGFNEEIIEENFNKIIYIDQGDNHQGILTIIKAKERYDLNFKFGYKNNEKIINELFKIFENVNKQSNELRFCDKLYVLLSIAYRIRNNLFHGVKKISALKQQKELFEMVNPVVAEFITAIPLKVKEELN